MEIFICELFLYFFLGLTVRSALGLLIHSHQIAVLNVADDVDGRLYFFSLFLFIVHLMALTATAHSALPTRWDDTIVPTLRKSTYNTVTFLFRSFWLVRF
jgi:hypothetical protein